MLEPKQKHEIGLIKSVRILDKKKEVAFVITLLTIFYMNIEAKHKYDVKNN